MSALGGGFNVMDGRKHIAIPWGLAELLYPAYGHGQTLERIHERGGFSRQELGRLAVDEYHDGHHRLARMPLLDLYERMTPKDELVAAVVRAARECRDAGDMNELAFWQGQLDIALVALDRDVQQPTDDGEWMRGVG